MKQPNDVIDIAPEPIELSAEPVIVPENDHLSALQLILITCLDLGCLKKVKRKERRWSALMSSLT
jgi:predicted transposase YbfD/YdcC